MKILLLGKTGQLGRELQRLLPDIGELTSMGQGDLDLSDIKKLRITLDDLKPDLVINASAYTAVDKAETETEKAMLINAHAPGELAKWAKTSRSVIIHFSTDYVFDGRKGAPYTENDPTNPLNVYGKSKLAGEQTLVQTGGTYLVLRTSWVYSMYGNSFVKKVLEWARKNETLKIVNDQISNPTWVYDLANATKLILSRNQNHLFDRLQDRSGIYHLAGSGFTSRYDWARQVLANDPRRTEQLVRSIEPVSSDEFPTPAIRPLFSALDCTKFETVFNLKMPDWKTSLKKAIVQ